MPGPLGCVWVVVGVRRYHFALLRTIEDAFELDHLGLAGAATLQPLGEDVFGAPQ